jgi:dihydropteroate synthase
VEQYGADIINDVSGGLWDEQMFDIMVRVRACYILTHTRWQTPDRQLAPTSPDGVLSEVLHFLQERVDRLHQAGVNDVIIDPGFGFGKTLEENYILLREMKVLHTLHCPIMVGLSRKSMLYKALQTTPANALYATTAANMLALINGTDILRVHDVKQAKETITIFKLCRTSR